MKVPKRIKEAYEKAILDYGKRYWQKHVAKEIAEHAKEYVERLPEEKK
jgi:hypothetical protein